MEFANECEYMHAHARTHTIYICVYKDQVMWLGLLTCMTEHASYHVFHSKCVEDV